MNAKRKILMKLNNKCFDFKLTKKLFSTCSKQQSKSNCECSLPVRHFRQRETPKTKACGRKSNQNHSMIPKHLFKKRGNFVESYLYAEQNAEIYLKETACFTKLSIEKLFGDVFLNLNEQFLGGEGIIHSIHFYLCFYGAF